jgi:putative DNA primase/helicase
MNEKDIAMNEAGNEVHPVWLTENHKIIEPEFCASYLAAHPMRCIHGHFYTVDGLLPDESRLKKAVYDEISPWLESKIAKKVDELLNALKMAAYSEPMPLQCDRLHVANGTYYLDGRFSEEKEFCRNRLSVAYRPDTPAPERWLRFLSELLAPEDIPRLHLRLFSSFPCP